MPLVTRLSTQGNVYRQATEPSGWLNGDLWIDTDNGNVYVNISGTATQIYPAVSAGITNDSIVNADINSSAAIAYSKLNLGTSIVNADVSTSAAIAVSKLAEGVFKQLGTNVLSGTADTISLTGLTAKKFLIARISILITTPVTVELIFNNDAGNISYRYSLNGAADTTATAATKILLASAIAGTAWEIWVYIPNTATARKWGYWIAVSNGAATDSSTAPDLIVGSFKYNSATAITRLDVTNTDTGDYLAGTEVTVWGTDLV